MYKKLKFHRKLDVTLTLKNKVFSNNFNTKDQNFFEIIQKIQKIKFLSFSLSHILDVKNFEKRQNFMRYNFLVMISNFFFFFCCNTHICICILYREEKMFTRLFIA